MTDFGPHYWLPDRNGENIAHVPYFRRFTGKPEGQEDQLGALGLVVNAIVLWNTLYMEATLNQLRAEGMEVNPEDVARLSPLIHKHMNFQGRYSFALSESVARGGLRPLRDPSEQDE